MPRKIDYAALDYSRQSALQRVSRGLAGGLFRTVTRLRVDGVERIPRHGPLIVVTNHLHILDSPLAFCVIPRRIVVIASAKWRHVPPIGTLATWVGDAIFTEGGDLRFLRALDVLRAGGAVGLAPEGTRSRTGGLGPPNAGAAILAARSGAPVLPMTLHGLDGVWRRALRLGRANVQVSIGRPFTLPRGPTTRERLRAHADQIMLALATLLPVEHRGIYADRVGNE